MSMTTNLRRRGKSWSVVYWVPKHLQETVGKREIVRGLGTRSLEEANRLKHKVLAEIAAELYLTDVDGAALERARKYDGSDDADLANRAYAEEIEKSRGEDAAVRFFKIATHQILPTSLAADAWLDEMSELGEHSEKLYRGHINDFVEFANDPAVKGVTTADAGRFTSWVLSNPSPKTGRPLAPSTFTAKIRTLNAFWTWMAVRGLVDPEKRNPWEAQAKVGAGKKGSKPAKDLRGITRDEAIAWAEKVKERRGKYAPAMRDLILLGWHSGARADDLCTLTADQISEDDDEGVTWIRFLGQNEGGGKTDANARMFPLVSPEAKAVIAARLEKNPEGRLFPEVKPKKGDKSPYQGIQQHFNDVRRKALGDAPVTYHSFRRHYTGALEVCTEDVALRHRMVGQKPPDFQAATYNRFLDRSDEFLSLARQIHQRIGELGV